MKLNHSIGSIAFLFVAPLVTGLSIGIAPSCAAIIAGSAAEVAIYNFSNRPINTATSAKTYTQTIADQGVVISQANAEAIFISNYPQLLAQNLSDSTVKSDGIKYSGLAQSQASILGDFNLDAKETFSFSFQTVLNLVTSVDNPQSERAIARGNISFSLIDTVSNILLDSFGITQSLYSFQRGDLNLSYSDGFNPTTINFGFLSEGNTKQSALYTSGVYSRTFDSATNLRLVEVKNNIAEAEAVPEPSTILGTTIFLGWLTRRKKLKINCFKLSKSTSNNRIPRTPTS
ncbi:MAG: PEP-CTERM sorting domain-containing protein [Microcoleus sp. CSU_2_2]|nr:PEP-CTERM sorting domain-containing protein [Microcoleus sp. SU_5_3]NJS12969.1 PEP-CTERM sorting domain-containing protein [Microcoleus sp. CSU_2_2]